jgi:hypothetical protein
MSDKDESKLNNEENFILQFMQVFDNHQPIFVHPSTKLYHAGILFNSIIDKEIDFVENTNNTFRTIYPEMRESFYKFCQKYTTSKKCLN